MIRNQWIKQKQKTKQKTTFELPDFYCLRGVIKTKFMMYSGVAQWGGG